jgi:hypothetical protein
MLDQPEFVDRPECCTALPSGSQSILEVCREELEFILGESGLRELETLAEDHRHSS